MLIDKNNALDFGLSNAWYKPSLIFKNHHVNTIYPYALRKNINPQYIRERKETVDIDFYDLDFVYKGSSSIAVLLHGLEGGSNSQYILGLTAALKEEAIDVCAVNHRSCSGEMNRKITLYHSGFIDDLISIIEDLAIKYDNIFIVGYSLGGNMTLKYLGSHLSIPSQVKAAVVFSVPCHLSSSAVMLNHWKNKAYTIQFLNTLNKKIVEKAKQFPDQLNPLDYKGIRTLYEYDNKVTAPIHGFYDAEDYYEKSSSKQYLHNIRIPALLVNALDDSFLAPLCFPYEIAAGNEYFHLLATKYGGHVGFAGIKHNNYWSDQIVKDWIKNYSKANELG
jgi:uncharacterized protein